MNDEALQKRMQEQRPNPAFYYALHNLIFGSLRISEPFLCQEVDSSYEPSSSLGVMNPSDRVTMTPSPSCQGATRDCEHHRDHFMKIRPFCVAPFLCIFACPY